MMKKQTWASFFSLGRSAMQRNHRSRAMMLYFQIKLLSASMDLLTRSVPPVKNKIENFSNSIGARDNVKQWKIKSWEKIERLDNMNE